MINLLEKLTQTDGVSGTEKAVRDIILKETEKYCDEVNIDAIGNIIAHKTGEGKKVMIAAHMDEIGVIVTFIDDNGFIRFSPVGGLITKRLPYKRVRFANGIIGVIGVEEKEFDKKASMDKLYIDIGAKNREEAENHISIGDTAAFVGEYYENDGLIVSKALDNRTGCYILIETMKQIKNNKNDLYFVFTAQEEVGLRGAKVSAYSVNPDFAIAVDVTDTGDTPSGDKLAVELGNGAAIKVMDRSVLCDIDVRETMLLVAKRLNIPYQLETMNDGGTDAGAIHLSRAGVKTGGISLPVRYIHSPAEMAMDSDISACIKLLTETVEVL